jgi:signal transduction histidine kinase
MRRGDRLYRRRALIILLAFVPPLGVDYLSGLIAIHYMNFDLSPVAIALSGAIMFWGLFRYRVLDVKPLAREEFIDNMSDALVVVSPDDRLMDYNKATIRLLAGKEGKAIGSPLAEALPFGKQLQDMIEHDVAKGDVTISGEKATSYEASIMPGTVQGEELARIVLLRDIADRKNMEEALRTANSRLGTLSSITRHDLGNKLTAIEGYAILAQESRDPVQASTYIARLRQVCSSANQLIEFAREYEKIGIAAPGWYSVGDLFHHAVVQNNVGAVNVFSEVNGVKVYADAMIEKVLYNLVDNSLRHGKKVTSLSLEGHLEGDTLVIQYADDGVGIPSEQKDRIFDRGFGSHTGLGLFLSREILGITGISIKENGTDGARFELRVPPGRYRLNN